MLPRKVCVGSVMYLKTDVSSSGCGKSRKFFSAAGKHYH
jgi:hypothetical protein